MPTTGRNESRLGRLAGVEDRRSPCRGTAAAGGAPCRRSRLGRRLRRWPVVVDEIDLLGLVESVLRRAASRIVVERGGGRAGRLRQRHVRDVERAERARAGDGVEVEPRRARGSCERHHASIAATSPTILGASSPRRSAPPGGRTYDDVDRVAGRRVGQPVDVASSPVPHHGIGVDAWAGAAAPERGERRQPTSRRFTLSHGTGRS